MSGKAKFRIPMFGKRKILEFQCLEKLKFKSPMLGKRPNLEFQCLEKVKI